MDIPYRVIIIDDDTINNTLCSVVIRKISMEADIQTFSIPEKGFQHIAHEEVSDEKPVLLFLDINMPGWSGWVFLENFEKLDDEIKKKFKIYMLSSSIDVQDRERAKTSKSVIDFVVKPLTTSKMLSILDATS